MLLYLGTIIFLFFLITLFGYLTHWALHQKFAGRFYNSHMAHHLRLYPTSDYTSEDKYREAGKDDTFYAFALASLPLLIAPIIFCILGYFSIFFTIFVLAIMLGIGYLHDYIHEAFHVNHHFLNRFRLVRYWGELHFFHHVRMDLNLGIFTFWVDRLCGTFTKKMPRP